jgi:hypothetical protein
MSRHPFHAATVGPLFDSPAKQIRGPWLMQLRAEIECVASGGHWWHPDGMIDWFCCQCGAEIDGMPPDNQPTTLIEAIGSWWIRRAAQPEPPEGK